MLQWFYENVSDSDDSKFKLNVSLKLMGMLGPKIINIQINIQMLINPWIS